MPVRQQRKEKNMWKVVGALLIGITVAGLVGCRSAPLYDVVDAPVVQPPRGQKLTADQVKSAIMQAGKSLGWQMEEVQPFLLQGTLLWDNHTAQVNIPYSAERYSIMYKDSRNLNYDGTNIHKNYNVSVQTLDRQIRNQMLQQ
jgi:hypothetical protein